MLATLAEGLKGTALVISKLKQKPIETTAAAQSRSAEEEVRKCSVAGRNVTEAGSLSLKTQQTRSTLKNAVF